MSTATTTFSPSSNRFRFSLSPVAASAFTARTTMASSSSIFLFPPLTKRALSLTLQSPHIAPFNGLRSSSVRTIRRRVSSPPPSSHFTIVASAQSNIYRVLQTTLRVARNGIEAGAGLVPDSVPRSVARIGVTVVGGIVALFLLKSFLSTLFFVLAMMGLIYFAFIALNADEGPRGGGGGGGGRGTSSTDEETLEEARRIMEKYKFAKEYAWDLSRYHAPIKSKPWQTTIHSTISGTFLHNSSSLGK